MMRLLPSVVVLVGSCIATSGQNSSPPPSSTPATTTDSLTSSSPADGGLVSCDTFVVRNKAQHDACKNKCQDDQRDQQRTCNDPNCLSGIGNFTRQCVAKCDSDLKAAKDAHCFLD
jgi:hypothetical protein